MAESSGAQLSNLKLSSDTIFFSPDTQSAELTLMNTHHSYHLYFKIKTKIEKIFEVKPVIGNIKPGEKQVVTFRPLKHIEPSQIKNLEQNLQFLIKVVNSQAADMKREEEEKLWKEIKQNHKHMELGYCSIKMNIAFSQQPTADRQFVPLFNKFQSKVQSKFTSNIKSSKGPKTSSVSDQGLRQSSHKQQLSDAQLSSKYEQLKMKEDRLLEQRKRIFGSITGNTPKKSSSLMLLGIVLVLSFLVGNYLKTSLATRVAEQKEGGFFDWLS